MVVTGVSPGNFVQRIYWASRVCMRSFRVQQERWEVLDAPLSWDCDNMLTRLVWVYRKKEGCETTRRQI